jgi:hypothetical protein
MGDDQPKFFVSWKEFMASSLAGVISVSLHEQGVRKRAFFP